MELSKIAYSQSPLLLLKNSDSAFEAKNIDVNKHQVILMQMAHSPQFANTSMESIIDEPLGLVSVFLSLLYSTPLLKKTHHAFGTTAANHTLSLFHFALFFKDHFIFYSLLSRLGRMIWKHQSLHYTCKGESNLIYEVFLLWHTQNGTKSIP